MPSRFVPGAGSQRDRELSHKIYISDIVKTGYCCEGTRMWFLQHRLSYRDLLDAPGIDVERFMNSGDGLSFRVVIATCVRRLRGLLRYGQIQT